MARTASPCCTMNSNAVSALKCGTGTAPGALLAATLLSRGHDWETGHPRVEWLALRPPSSPPSACSHREVRVTRRPRVAVTRLPHLP